MCFLRNIFFNKPNAGRSLNVSYVIKTRNRQNSLKCLLRPPVSNVKNNLSCFGDDTL